MEGAAGGGVDGARNLTRDLGVRPPARRDVRDRLEQHPGVGVARSAEELPPVPISTTLPKYMTAIRSAMCRMTARSWLMRR